MVSSSFNHVNNDKNRHNDHHDTNDNGGGVWRVYRGKEALAGLVLGLSPRMASERWLQAALIRHFPEAGDVLRVSLTTTQYVWFIYIEPTVRVLVCWRRAHVLGFVDVELTCLVLLTSSLRVLIC